MAGECMVLPCVWREVMSARNCFVLNRRITARSAAARSLNVCSGGREEGRRGTGIGHRRGTQ